MVDLKKEKERLLESLKKKASGRDVGIEKSGERNLKELKMEKPILDSTR